MKLLDPFAGYQLASGHPVFHVALFVGSFTTAFFGKSGNDEQIESAFKALRWSHFILIVLAVASEAALQGSKIPKKPKLREGEERSEELEILKVEHRDGAIKMFGRICDTLSVFMYTAAVFYAQMLLALETFTTNPVTGQLEVKKPEGNLTLWLYIETASFYAYLLAVICYIAWRQLKGITSFDTVAKSDLNKAISDYINYSKINLNWYSFNFVLCLLPPICIFGLEPQSRSLVIKDREGSYFWVMVVVWAMNFLQFMFNLTIYKLRKDTIEEVENNKPTAATSVFSKIGSFQSDKDETDRLNSKSKKEIQTEHYEPMERVFDVTYWQVWVLSASVNVGAFIAFLIIPGKELVYCLYLPFDILVTATMGIYYVYLRQLDKVRQREEDQLRQIVQEKLKSGIAARLQQTLLMKKASADEKNDDSFRRAKDDDDKNTDVASEEEKEQLYLRYEQAKRRMKIRRAHLADVVTADQELKLSDDTYAAGFKALHWETQRQLELEPSDVHEAFMNALMVFGIQCLMVSFVVSYMLTTASFQIILPPNTAVMGARFICSILMHLQVESDMRQGLRMMKLVTNQREDFSNPDGAFLIAFMQSFGGIAAEIGCMLFLGSLEDPINTIIRFIALASIAKVDDFYFSALPDENKIKGDSDAIKITVFKRELDGKNDLGFDFKVKRFIYKTIRILYSACIFYFLPYAALFIPYICTMYRYEQQQQAASVVTPVQ